MVANMIDGRNSRLVFLCHTLQQMNIDICITTETKIQSPVHTRHSTGYNIFCTYTDRRRNQGGLALIVRNDGTKRP